MQGKQDGCFTKEYFLEKYYRNKGGFALLEKKANRKKRTMFCHSTAFKRPVYYTSKWRG